MMTLEEANVRRFGTVINMHINMLEVSV